MLFQMLHDYIKYQLYISKEEVHEKIVVNHALDKLTSGEFLTLFEMIYPKETQEVELETDECKAVTLEELYEEPQEVELHPMPQIAKDIVGKLYQAKMLTNANNKLHTFVETGQLTEAECLQLVSPDEGIALLPELGEEETIESETVEVVEPKEEEGVAQSVGIESVQVNESKARASVLKEEEEGAQPKPAKKTRGRKKKEVTE